jgi:hypothetical protein
MKSQNTRNKGFSIYFCLMTEGSGSGPLAKGTGFAILLFQCLGSVSGSRLLRIHEILTRIWILGSVHWIKEVLIFSSVTFQDANKKQVF